MVFRQLDLFTDIAQEQEKAKEEKAVLEREKKAQLAMLRLTRVRSAAAPACGIRTAG